MANIGSHRLYTVGNALAVLSHLEIDADGSPRAYAPAGSGLPALDYLANAGRPGRWFGVATDAAGEPFIQGPDDPFPGYYVSTTALEDGAQAFSNPRRYVDSERVPYVVIPGAPHFGVNLRDVGFALNLATGDSSEFIVADVGPANRIGEGSMKLAHNLGIDPNPRTGGSEADTIAYCFFPGEAVPWPSPALHVLSEASNRFLALGGFDRLKQALPAWDWRQFSA